MVRMPALCVDDAQPPLEFAQPAILAWPERQMQVIAHQTIGQQVRFKSLKRFAAWSFAQVGGQATAAPWSHVAEVCRSCG
jgi:hypothetical protein